MFSRPVRLAVAAALTLPALIAAGAIASAQVEVGGLENVDPFGRGYLAEGEQAMPTQMWQASNTETLLALMKDVRTSALTPAERTLLRRVVLSPATRPAGDQANALLAERARIMFELGEADAAADLLGRLEENPTGLDASTLAVDLQLAMGQSATACEAGRGKAADAGAFWAKLRTVCALLREDTAAAELAAELASAQGVDEAWFFDAVFAATGGTGDGPPARYDSGLNLALSIAAGLEPPERAIADSRGDLAAAMAGREALPIELRVLAAGLAAEAGLIAPDRHRALYRDLVSRDGFTPAQPIDVAMYTLADAEAPMGEQARQVASALRAARGTPARFAAVARLFSEDIEALPRERETFRHALTFAQAALAAGSPDRARAWVDGLRDFLTAQADAEAAADTGDPKADSGDGETPADLASAPPEAGEPGADVAAETLAPPPPVEVEAYDLAWTEGLTVLASPDPQPSEIEAAAGALIEAAETENQIEDAVRLMTLWTALDIPPPAAARETLLARDGDFEGAAAWRLIALRAAAEAGAAGEVVVSALGLTDGDPSRLSPRDALDTVEALKDIALDDAARRLALEATGYWKAARR